MQVEAGAKMVTMHVVGEVSLPLVMLMQAGYDGVGVEAED